MAADPLQQLSAWLDVARSAGQPLPEAMCLATASTSGVPSARMVLLRGIDHGIVFFTDDESDKGVELLTNPSAATVLHWTVPVHRQVRVSGTVDRVSAEESDRYWRSRPEGSRRSAVASHQSHVVASRAVLERRVAALAALAPDDPELGRPVRWGGFRITPVTVELWEEGADRLHDRLRFRRDGAVWSVERLSP